MQKKRDIRILLVDDHPVVRAGIRHLLQKEEDLVVVGEAGDGREALRLAKELSPDVILLDMELPGMSGDLVAKQLLKENSSVRILVLSAHTGKAFIENTLEIGAAGYLTKDEVTDTLIEAVRGVANGEQGWISRRVTSQMTDMIRELRLKEKNALTTRERQVLKGVVEGKTNKRIGFSLGINEKTVEKHLESIFEKLEVSSRVEAAVVAVREQITQK